MNTFGSLISQFLFLGRMDQESWDYLKFYLKRDKLPLHSGLPQMKETSSISIGVLNQ